MRYAIFLSRRAEVEYYSRCATNSVSSTSLPARSDQKWYLETLLKNNSSFSDRFQLFPFSKFGNDNFFNPSRTGPVAAKRSVRPAVDRHSVLMVDTMYGPRSEGQGDGSIRCTDPVLEGLSTC